MRLLLPLLALGCDPHGSGKVPGTDPPTPPTPPIVDTGDTVPTPTSTGDTGSVIVDTDTGTLIDVCANLPTQPLSWVTLPSSITSEEFAFDASGYVINASDGADGVFRTLYLGSPELVTPYSAFELAGTRFTSTGLLAICDEFQGAVIGVDIATGAQTLLLGGVNSPNSLGFDDRGFMYVATFEQILRVDLALPKAPVEVLLNVADADFDGITFSPSYDRVYFNHDDGGTVGYLELDAAGTVLSTQVLALLNVGWGSELDGMAVDACGNVYVVAVDGLLRRITPDGVVITFAEINPPGGAWTTALNFGSGVGSWGRDRLYVMDRNNGLVELEVGVEGRPEVHLP